MNNNCMEDVIGVTQASGAPEPAYSTELISADQFTTGKISGRLRGDQRPPGECDDAAITSVGPASRAPVHAHPFSATALMLRRRSAFSRTTLGRA
ncbi:MAG: hypothetical protein ACK51N_04125 [bacterium]|jgi:hypothetical protein|nr:hypothetical protein [Phycisphaerales bacterium]MCE2654052.1 hypothetical protein [Planctomycetaceae bacterium]